MPTHPTDAADRRSRAALNGALIGDAIPTSIGHCAVEFTDVRRGREDEPLERTKAPTLPVWEAWGLSL